MPATSWRRYDHHLFPVFHERFEERWGPGTAPFLDPSVFEEGQPRPRAQWINVDTGAAAAVVPVWEDDAEHRSFAVCYLPPAGGICQTRVVSWLTPTHQFSVMIVSKG